MLALALAAQGQILSPTTAGALDRADAYAALAVWPGTLDALGSLALPAGLSEARQAAWFEAESLFGLARYGEAAEAYAAWLELDPTSPARSLARLRMAECALAQADYSLAAQLIRDIDPEALDGAAQARRSYDFGICLLAEGHTDRAEAAFAAAAAMPGTLRPAANFYLGTIAFAKGDFSTARRYLAASDPRTEPGRRRDIYISQIELAGGNNDLALESARRGLSLNGLSDAEAATLEAVAGEALWRQRRFGEALTHLRRHMDLAPAPANTVRYMLGVDAFENRKYDEAVELLTPAAENAAGVLGQSASLMLGQALVATGRHDAAVAAFDKAIKASPSDPEVRRQAFYNYAVAKSKGGSLPFGSSASTFEAFLADYPTGPYSDRVREYLAEGYLADEDYMLALERLEAIDNPSRKVREATRHLLYLLGCQELNAGNPDAATRYLDRAADMPGDAALTSEITLWQGRVLAAKGNHAAAASRFNTYLRSQAATNRPAANYALGYAEFARRRYDAADAAFAAAESSNAFSGKELADILNRRADIAYYNSRFGDAAALYGRAFAADRASGDYAAFQRARMSGYQRDYAADLRALDEFERAFPTSSLMPDVLLERAAAQVALGRTADAVATYDTLTERFPLTSQGRRGYIQKAMVLLESGQLDAAADAYKEVVRRFPTSDEAAQASSLLRGIMADRGRGDEYLAFMNSVEGAPAVDRRQAATLTYGSAERALQAGDAAPMERFLVDYPDAPEAESALALLAEADYVADRTPEALARWQELEPKASTPAMALRARMGILRAARDLGDTSLSGQAAERVLESSAATNAAINEATYSRALYLSEDSLGMSRAIELWQSVADDTDDLYGAKSAYAAAEALYNLGRIDEADEAATALASSRSPHRYWIARAFILRSDILASQDKKLEAREYLRALLQNYPGNETDIRVMAEQRLEQLSEQ